MKLKDILFWGCFIRGVYIDSSKGKEMIRVVAPGLLYVGLKEPVNNVVKYKLFIISEPSIRTIYTSQSAKSHFRFQSESKKSLHKPLKVLQASFNSPEVL